MAATFSFYSHPKALFKHGLRCEQQQQPGNCVLVSMPDVLVYVNYKRFCLRSRRCFTVRAAASASSGRSGSGRKTYLQSEAPVSAAPAQDIAGYVMPAGFLLVGCIVLWRLIAKPPSSKIWKESSAEKESNQGKQWSFSSIGTTLLPGLAAKYKGDSQKVLHQFAKELTSATSVDMSGRSFGDEGIIFLAGGLGYNQNVVEANFAANGITSNGIKVLAGALGSNIVLKSINISGNTIGDEGATMLAKALEGNYSLEKLQLNSVGMGDEGAKAIGEMLKKNSTIRILELNNNLIDYSVWAEKSYL